MKLIKAPRPYHNEAEPIFSLCTGKTSPRIEDMVQEFFSAVEHLPGTLLHGQLPEFENASLESTPFYLHTSWILGTMTNSRANIFLIEDLEDNPFLLYQLGFARDKPSVVYCPPQAKNRGFVELFCQLHGQKLCTTQLFLVQYLKNELKTAEKINGHLH